MISYWAKRTAWTPALILGFLAFVFLAVAIAMTQMATERATGFSIVASWELLLWLMPILAVAAWLSGRFVKRPSEARML